MAVFDGDYATATCALAEPDLVQTCVQAWVESSVRDRWLMRRLPQLATRAGLKLLSFRGHAYVEAPTGGYMLAIGDRGADALLPQGRIGTDTAAALKAEARRRSDAGEFFGHIAYTSLIARSKARRPRGLIRNSKLP